MRNSYGINNLEFNPLKKVKSSPYLIYREITYGFRYVTEKTIKVYENGKKEIIKIEKY
jgi:hypothetical protein